MCCSVRPRRPASGLRLTSPAASLAPAACAFNDALGLLAAVLPSGVGVEFAGGTGAGISDALSRPEVFAFGGEAWPTSSRQVMRAMANAVSAPLIATVVVAAFAIPLSLVLIELEGNTATIVFSVVGALVLGGTTLAAARPWDKEGASDTGSQ